MPGACKLDHVTHREAGYGPVRAAAEEFRIFVTIRARVCILGLSASSIAALRNARTARLLLWPHGSSSGRDYSVGPDLVVRVFACRVFRGIFIARIPALYSRRRH